MRKINERFIYEKTKLKVVANQTGCGGCFFDEIGCGQFEGDPDYHCSDDRADHIPVIFVIDKFTYGK